jgi:hypothetical protein
MRNRLFKAAVLGAGLLLPLASAPAATAAPTNQFRASSNLVSQTVTSSRTAGPVTVLTLSNVTHFVGDLSGTGAEQARLVVTADGVVFVGDMTCTCTFEGRTGPVRMRGGGTGTPAGFGGPFVIVGQQGGLEGLVITGTISGVGPSAGLSGTVVRRP